MKFERLSYVCKGILLLCAIMPLGISVSYADNGDWNKENKIPKAPVPVGYIKYITFLGDGVYQSPDGTIFVDGIAGDGMAFQREIMGRSDAEIETQKGKAVDFFLQRFGIDAFDSANILFTGYEVDSRNNLRVLTESGEKVPPEGWKVHDGGFQVIVVNPDGITLGGEFEGVHVPANTALVFGEYKIVKEAVKSKKAEQPVVLRYRSKEPLIFSDFGSVVRCEVSSDKHGPGFTAGLVGTVQGENGVIQANIKTIITFPSLGPNTLLCDDCEF